MFEDRPSTFADGFLRQTNFCKMLCESCLTRGDMLLTGNDMISKNIRIPSGHHVYNSEHKEEKTMWKTTHVHLIAS